MVFDELRNDYELEELDEFHLFDNPKSELVPIIHLERTLPNHLIIGVTGSAHTFTSGFGFEQIAGYVEIGSIKWDIKSSDDGSIWILNVPAGPEPNNLASKIVEKIPAQMTSIIDIVLDDQVYEEKRGDSVSILKLESSAVEHKSNLPKLAIPGFISGVSAALLSMLDVRGRQCRVFLAISDYQSLAGINPEIVNKLMECIPELFPEAEMQDVLSKIKKNIANLKPMARSAMFV